MPNLPSIPLSNEIPIGYEISEVGLLQDQSGACIYSKKDFFFEQNKMSVKFASKAS